MALENDGKNAEQFDWACLDDLLLNFVLTKLWEDREVYGNWPQESTINTLVIWLFWHRLDSEKLAALPDTQRSTILQLVRPYALIGPRYPPFHAPDCHFTLPMRPDRAYVSDQRKVVTPHGYWPLYRVPAQSIHYLEHYGTILEITEPLLALGAQLVFFTLYWQPLIIPPDMPVDRAHAIALGRTGVNETQADLLEYNASSPVKLVEKGDPDWRSRLTEEEGKREDSGTWMRGLRSLSAKWECDYNRLVGCVDPYALRPKAVTYQFGALTGLWKGLHLNPHPDQYFTAVRAGQLHTDLSHENPRVFMHPVYLQFREHHCISPALPIPCGGNPLENDDGINHAWLPSSVEIREGNGIARVRDLQRLGEPAAVYETYVEGRRNSHNPDTCHVCVARTRLDETLLAEKVKANNERASSGAPSPRPSSSSHTVPGTADKAALSSARAAMNAALGPGEDVDELINDVMADVPSPPPPDDDYDEEYRVDTTCVGIQDIIITGETLPHHGEAWYQYQCYGRVRPWDGLIALVRVPVRSPGRFGVYIFRGYIVAGRNFVGSWRVRTDNTRAVPLEGPFIMSKVE